MDTFIIIGLLVVVWILGYWTGFSFGAAYAYKDIGKQMDKIMEDK